MACVMVMDQARGLFHRAIAHGVASPCYSVEVAAATTLEVAAMAGSRATPECLLSTSPQVLVAASDRVVDEYRDDPGSGARHYDPVIYAPVVDGDVLPMDPLSGVAAGAARDVDLLVCHTTEESWLFDAVGSSAKVTTDEQLATFATDFGLPDDLMAGYRAAMPKSPVLDNDGAAFLIGGTSNAADRDLSRRMVQAWADFATTGDPGWPPIMGSTTPVRTWTADDAAAKGQGHSHNHRPRPAHGQTLAVAQRRSPDPASVSQCPSSRAFVIRDPLHLSGVGTGGVTSNQRS